MYSHLYIFQWIIHYPYKTRCVYKETCCHETENWKIGNLYYRSLKLMQAKVWVIYIIHLWCDLGVAWVTVKLMMENKISKYLVSLNWRCDRMKSEVMNYLVLDGLFFIVSIFLSANLGLLPSFSRKLKSDVLFYYLSF